MESPNTKIDPKNLDSKNEVILPLIPISNIPKPTRSNSWTSPRKNGNGGLREFIAHYKQHSNSCGNLQPPYTKW
jgi:hypothetical protein